MDLERMFDLVTHMNVNPGEDYVFDKKKNIALNYKQQGYVLHKAIQAFFQGVGVKDNKKVIQAFSGSSDLPVLTKDIFNVTNIVNAYDILWQNAFKGIPLKKGQLSWEIADVSAGITFKLIPEGGKAEFYGVSGSKTTANIDKYGAGLGVSWEIIEGRKLYRFVDLMEQTKAALYKIWADIHYGLLATAAGTHTIAWQGASTDPTLDRDIGTLNKGYETIGSACKDKGYGDTANAPMILFATPSVKSRILHAMRVTTSDVARGRAPGAASSSAGKIVIYPITAYYTWNSNIAADKAVMVLPRNKIQNSMYLRELGLNEKDIATLAEMRTYWTAFGAIVGDTEQTAELSFS